MAGSGDDGSIDLPLEIRRARQRKELPKTRASKEMGVSRLTYDMWEKGAWVPDVERAQQIATFAELPKADVLTYLLRANGVLDQDTYLDLKRVQR